MEDYELRELIRSKKVTADTKVWHEGADDWLPAREVQFLKKDFPTVEPPPIPQEAPVFHMWRRFVARWFDMMLYVALLAVVFRLAGIRFMPTPEEQLGISALFRFLPMVIMEGALLSAFGITPGKYLMALKVTRDTGELISAGAAIMRSLRVWVLGMGMNLPILTVIGHEIAVWFGKKRGAPIWDLVPPFRVTGKVLNPQKIVLLVVGVLAINGVLTWATWEEMAPYREDSEKWMEQWRK